jgi:tetratricopeptide (TPR) repeat protein
MTGSSADRPSDLTPPPPSPAIPGNGWFGRFPQDVRDFQNRVEQRARLVRLLRDESVPLVVVTGVDGIGKTAMLSHLLWAVRRGQQLGDGARLELPHVLYVELRRPQAATLSSLLSAIKPLVAKAAMDRLRGVIDDDTTTAVKKAEALADAFEGRRVLIVLDDFEELVDPDTQKLWDPRLQAVVDGLLDLSPGHVKVVALTSVPLDALWLANVGRLEEPLRLGGLPQDYAEELLRAKSSEAHAWLERLTPEHRTAAWKRLGGHPRAIQTLAACIGIQPQAVLSVLLEDRALPREVDNALMGRTLAHLGRAERLVLAALAVYGLPVPETAIDELLGSPANGTSRRRALGRLLQLELVRIYEDPATDGSPGASGSTRFELHLAPRDLLLEDIPEEPGEAPYDHATLTRTALLRRGADWFQSVAASAPKAIGDLWPKFGEFDLLVRARDYDEAAMVLYEIATPYLLTWGYADTLLGKLSRVDGKVSDPEVELAVAGLLGHAYQQLARHEEALAALARARGLAERQGDNENLARVSLLEAGSSYSIGKVSAAARAYRKGVTAVRELAEEQGAPPDDLRTVETAARIGLGLCGTDQGQLPTAEGHFRKAKTLLRDLDEPRLPVQLQNEWGKLHLERGQPDVAIEHFDAGLAIAAQDSIAYRLGQGRCLLNKAKALIDLTEHRDAVELTRDAMRIGEAIGNSALTRDSNDVRALALLCENELEEAQAAIDAACRTIDDPMRHRAYHSAFALQGVIALLRGDDSGASEAFGTARTRAKDAADMNQRDYLAWDSRGLAQAGYVLRFPHTPGELRQAVEFYKTARRYCSERGAIAHAARLLTLLPDPEGKLTEIRRAAMEPYLRDTSGKPAT